MKIDGVHRRSIDLADDGPVFEVIDQTRLPHELVIERIETALQAASAITEMRVRGAPLIGATAACGLWLGLCEDPSNEGLSKTAELLLATRPTAVNLRWAVDRVVSAVSMLEPAARAEAARREAELVCEEDVAINRAIGSFGLPLIEDAWERNGKDRPVNVLTHCNAGWLATVDWGTALAPVYMAHDAGIAVHVWVDETRPRLQGALTAWELSSHGVSCTVIADNAGGLLMRRGEVDLCIVGSDRTTARGDVCNKIGTYLKALAARDCAVPFYVALPHPTIDWSILDGQREIPIEDRGSREVTEVRGLTTEGVGSVVRPFPDGTRVANPAFDVTPARLVTALITDRGVCSADSDGLLSLFPEASHPRPPI